MSDHKTLGNEALKKKDFASAISHYTNGIQETPSNHILFSNRAAAYLSSQKYPEAIADASKAVELKPDWIKGYIRKAQAQMALNQLQEAMQTIQQGLQHEAQNPQLIRLMQGLLQRQQQSNPQMQAMMNVIQQLQDPNLLDRIKQNPKVASLASQDDFVQSLKELQQNPQNLQQALQDPRMLVVLKEVCGLPVQTPSYEDQMRRENEEADRRRAERKRKEEEEAEKKRREEEERNKRPEMQEKLKGNEAYKKRDFETALTHYSKAIEIDPSNITFHLNRASVYIESKKYDECIKECEETLSMAREQKADFQDVAKIYAKMGNCYLRQEKYEQAIDNYKSSLLEHRARPVVLALKKAEQELEKQRKQAYIDPEKSNEARARGSELFKQQKYPEAKKEYDEAIKRDPSNHLNYSNRCATYMKLGAYPNALRDIEECLRLKPDFVKGYSRKGQCHQITREFHKALQTYDEGLKYDPQNADLLRRRQQLIVMINSGGAETEEEKAKRRNVALTDPEIQNILSDPQFQHVLNKLSSDPQAAAELMKDPQIRERVEKLVAAGVIDMK